MSEVLVRRLSKREIASRPKPHHRATGLNRRVPWNHFQKLQTNGFTPWDIGLANKNRILPPERVGMRFDIDGTRPEYFVGQDHYRRRPIGGTPWEEQEDWEWDDVAPMRHNFRPVPDEWPEGYGIEGTEFDGPCWCHCQGVGLAVDQELVEPPLVLCPVCENIVTSRGNGRILTMPYHSPQGKAVPTPTVTT